MFSATKFVAGAIVALFGGFLLTGVMTQPSDEQTPAVGASASAMPQATPTEMTAEPEPLTEAADTTTRSDLLPGVDLVTVEVAPGVLPVVSDGEHDLRTNVWDVAVGPDGDVWVVKYRIVYADGFNPERMRVRYLDPRVLRLGAPGVALPGASDGAHTQRCRWQARWGLEWSSAGPSPPVPSPLPQVAGKPTAGGPVTQAGGMPDPHPLTRCAPTSRACVQPLHRGLRCGRTVTPPLVATR